MTRHAKDTLARTRIPKILDLALAIPTTKTSGTKGLVASEDGEVFDLVSASIAAICAIVADE